MLWPIKTAPVEPKTPSGKSNSLKSGPAGHRELGSVHWNQASSVLVRMIRKLPVGTDDFSRCSGTNDRQTPVFSSALGINDPNAPLRINRTIRVSFE